MSYIPQWTIVSGILNSGDTHPKHPSKAVGVDDPELGAHRHHMPDWGHILWRRYWEMSAQVDRHASQIHHLKEKLMSVQDDLDALTARVNTDNTNISNALADLKTQVADLQAQVDAGGTVADLSGLTAAVDALDAVVPAPVDTPPADQPPAA